MFVLAQDSRRMKSQDAHGSVLDGPLHRGGLNSRLSRVPDFRGSPN